MIAYNTYIHHSSILILQPIPEASLKTCLICLQTDATEGIEFMQVNSCDPEEKSYMLKIQEIMNQSVVRKNKSK